MITHIKNPLLLEQDRLHVLIDSESINQDILNSDKNLERFLRYNETELFSFLRTPLNINHENLKIVTELTSVMTQDDTRMIEVIRSRVLGKDTLSYGEKSFILMILFYSQLYPNYKTILVTSNKIFIKNHRFLKPYFHNVDLRMVSIKQALKVMDLFAKSKDKYYYTNHSTVDKRQWYLLYFRSKIPHFHFPVPVQGSFAGSQILDAFASRFINLLISADEIGIQFYFGKYKALMISYHFNYLISLVTGIFDNLAIETRNKYNIKFKGDNNPSRISLSNKTGNEFLKQIRNKNPLLRNHINNYVDFINLVYELREPVLHREGLKEMAYYWDLNSSNLIVITNDIKELIKQIQMFTRSMYGISVAPVMTLPKIFDFSDHKKMIDIGGGSGIYSIQIVKTPRA